MREGFTHDIGKSLIEHLTEAAAGLAENPPLKSVQRSGFAH